MHAGTNCLEREIIAIDEQINVTVYKMWTPLGPLKWITINIKEDTYVSLQY